MQILGGQFKPESGGQFEMADGGQFHLAGGGQFEWIFHYAFPFLLIADNPNSVYPSVFKDDT